MIVEFDNETFAKEFARRLNRLVRDYPDDMVYLGGQPLPTGTEGGSMVLWRIFSLLCLEGHPGFLIVPHQSQTTIGAIHAIPASEHEEYRTRRKELPEPDRLPPQMGNATFAAELARRINRLYGDYPEWVMHWLTCDLLVRNELCREIILPGVDIEGEVMPIGLSVLLSLACSANADDEPFGIAPLDEISPDGIVKSVAGRDVSEKSPEILKH